MSGTIHARDARSGSVICWHAPAREYAIARQAPISLIPASYQQIQDLRGFTNSLIRYRLISRA
jgi:hypothetical protein